MAADPPCFFGVNYVEPLPAPRLLPSGRQTIGPDLHIGFAVLQNFDVHFAPNSGHVRCKRMSALYQKQTSRYGLKYRKRPPASAQKRERLLIFTAAVSEISQTGHSKVRLSIPAPRAECGPTTSPSRTWGTAAGLLSRLKRLIEISP